MTPPVGPALARQEMQADAKPAAAPSDGAPSSENPALIKMSNQHTKLGPARSEEPAPTKLDNQHNTQAMPVRTRTTAAAQSPLGRDARREPRAVPTVAAPAAPRPHGPYREPALQPPCADRMPVSRR